VEGATLERAKEVLRHEQLDWRVTLVVCEPVQQGIVLKQEPQPGEQVLQGSEVKLQVGGGPLGVVPHVTGIFAGAARTLIENAGFSCTVLWLGDGKPLGIVASQDPTGGTAGDGKVTIWVGGDGRDVTVPDVAGLTVADARAALAKVGLDAAVAEGADGDGATVSAQDPAAGAGLTQGEAVALTPQTALQFKLLWPAVKGSGP
jgi:beta-lactam-binding protein with PASTA domain